MKNSMGYLSMLIAMKDSAVVWMGVDYFQFHKNIYILLND